MRYSTASSPASTAAVMTRSVELFKLSTVRALGILKEDHVLIRIGVADKDSAFRGMTGGRDHWISRFHCRFHLILTLFRRVGAAADTPRSLPRVPSPFNQALPTRDRSHRLSPTVGPQQE